MPARHAYALSIACSLLCTGVCTETSAEGPADTRIFVELPAATQLLRQDMLSHPAALNSIVAALGSGDLQAD